MPAEPLTLLAEDDDNDVYFLQRAFEQALIPHPLRRVADGEEAIDYLRGEGKYADRDAFPLPTMLMLDLKMPGRSAREVFVEMRTVAPQVPVLICSGYGDNEEVQSLITLGARGLLSKPFTLSELAEKLAAVRA